jgi:putative nucleotidyltransferase with HDIG domain
MKAKGNILPPEPGQAELVLAQIESLPTLSAVAVRLLELANDERSSGREVVRVIESDPSLSARLLALTRRANVGVEAKTVQRAVVLLGLETVRNLVLSVQTFEAFPHRREQSGTRFNRLEFWKHSLAVGCAAKLLAERCGGKPVRPEEAFICGLLHDIGKIAMDACFPKSYDRVIARVEDRAGCLADVEREMFGLDHALAGSRLAAHWRLPAMITESVWLHHNSPATTPGRLAFPGHVRLVQVADRLARHMRIGYSGNHVVDEPLWESIATIGLTSAALDEVTAALPELVAARAEFIGLDRLTSSEVYEAALAQANTELARANESLAESNRRLQQRSGCFEAVSALRTAIGEDPTHERVARAAAVALARLLDTERVAVLTCSPAKGALAIAADDSRVDLVLTSEVGDLGFVAQSPTGWLPGSLLPVPLVDRLAAALQGPPAWCLPIRNQHGFAAAVCVAGEEQPDADEMLLVAADWIGAWLGSAESAVAARRLNEELAETSRRLLASQAESASNRSLALVGEMAAGAAHELNNPLMVISGRAQLLNREGAPEEVRKAAALIAEHAQRASGIVSDLMEFAKPSSPQPSVWDLPAMLEEIRREWLEKKMLASGQFRLEIPAGLPKVRADAGQMRMLFDELLRNAVEATRDNSEPFLVINCRLDVADETVVIRVQDNGCGMTPEVLERAFAPFYSYRPAGRGRGLGLSKAARFADINGGRLRLFSRPAEGTQAILELPAVVG